MRTNVQQRKQTEGPLGVRPGVWLFVITVILGLLAVSLLRHGAEKRPDHVEFGRVDRTMLPAHRSGRVGTPVAADLPASLMGMLKTSVPVPGRPLSPQEAQDLACLIANQKARELYDCEPFTQLPPARFAEGCWMWSEYRGRGLLDLEATVQFCEDGSMPSVDVNVLILGPRL